MEGDEHDDDDDDRLLPPMTVRSGTYCTACAGYFTVAVGVLASSSGRGEITLSGMNVIRPRARHQHINLRLRLDYIMKGREEGSKRRLAFTGGYWSRI